MNATQKRINREFALSFDRAYHKYCDLAYKVEWGEDTPCWHGSDFDFWIKPGVASQSPKHIHIRGKCGGYWKDYGLVEMQ